MRINWTPDMDAAMRAIRQAGASWLETADHVGVEVKSALRRAKKLGIPTARMNIGPVGGKAVIAGFTPTSKAAIDRWQRRTT
jgi:hypothetical protein